MSLLVVLLQWFFILWATPLMLTPVCPGARGLNQKISWPLERNYIPKMGCGLHNRHCWQDPAEQSLLPGSVEKTRDKAGSTTNVSAAAGEGQPDPVPFLLPLSTLKILCLKNVSWRTECVTALLKITLRCVQTLLGMLGRKNNNHSSLHLPQKV